MKNHIVILLVLTIIVSCQPILNNEKVIDNYFDIGSLLDTSTSSFENYPVSVFKQLEIDGKQEEHTISLTKEELQKEIEMLQLMDINQSGLIGAYDEEKSANSISYKLRKQEKQNGIINLSIEETGNRKKLSGNFIEKNSLYYSAREFQVTIENNLLKSYQITGTQKMMFKDTVSFSINLAIKK